MERGVVAELIEPRNCAPVPQQRLRRHQDQWLADFAMQLAPQHVEEISGRGGSGPPAFVFGAHLQDTLKTGGGMFRSLPFITMRQQQTRPDMRSHLRSPEEMN